MNAGGLSVLVGLLVLSVHMGVGGLLIVAGLVWLMARG